MFQQIFENINQNKGTINLDNIEKAQIDKDL